MITSNNSLPWLHVVSDDCRPYGNYGANPGAGMVRYNIHLSCLEVTDGMNWHQYRPRATVELSPEAQNALSWASAKMQEERRLEDLMSQHPGLRDLHERFRVMLALVQKSGDGEHGS